MTAARGGTEIYTRLKCTRKGQGRSSRERSGINNRLTTRQGGWRRLSVEGRGGEGETLANFSACQIWGIGRESKDKALGSKEEDKRSDYFGLLLKPRKKLTLEILIWSPF